MMTMTMTMTMESMYLHIKSASRAGLSSLIPNGQELRVPVVQASRISYVEHCVKNGRVSDDDDQGMIEHQDP